MIQARFTLNALRRCVDGAAPTDLSPPDACRVIWASFVLQISCVASLHDNGRCFNSPTQRPLTSHRRRNA